MSQLHLNWVRAAILAANDGVVSVTALSVGVASIRPSAVLVAALGLLAAGASSMAAGEYMSVVTLTDAEEAASLAVSANP